MLIRPFRLEMKKAHRRSRSCGFRVKCETHPRLEIIPKSIALFLGTAFISLAPLAGYGFSQAPFYQGKTVTLIVSTAPGGTGDLRVKALVPFLRKHIPGNPTIVTEYMDGGGGRKAANYLFRNARSDGLPWAPWAVVSSPCTSWAKAACCMISTSSFTSARRKLLATKPSTPERNLV